MKKVTIIAVVTILSALTLSSCTKEDIPVNNIVQISVYNNGRGGQTFLSLNGKKYNGTDHVSVQYPAIAGDSIVAIATGNVGMKITYSGGIQYSAFTTDKTGPKLVCRSKIVY